MVGGWGIYSPNHQTSRLVKAAVAWCTGQSGAPPDTVRCTCHVTWPLDSDRWSFCLLGHRIVRCATWHCSDSGVHCSASNAFCRRLLARCSCCSAGTPNSPVRHRTLFGATPDSPVNYSGAAFRIPEGELSRTSTLFRGKSRQEGG
jgi:hypothetical protein